MVRIATVLLVICLKGLFGAPLEAATIEFDDRPVLPAPGVAPRPGPILHITGPIEPGDADKVRSLLTPLKGETGRPLVTAELEGDGGDLAEALRIGRLLREHTVATVVRSGKICRAACALAFLGGTAEAQSPSPVASRTVEFGGQVGFLLPMIEPSTLSDGGRGAAARSFAQSRAASAAVIRYGADLGIASQFIARLFARPPGEAIYLETNRDFQEASACLAGNEPRLPRLDEQAVNVCSHVFGRASSAEPLRSRGLSIRQMKRTLLEHVQNSIAGYNVGGMLANQLAAVIAARDDRLIDTVYADLVAAGVPLPEPHDRSFVVEGHSEASAPIDCHVTLSLSRPDSYDVALVGPSGFIVGLQVPPAYCPRLFRYGRDEMLNPRR